MSVPPSNTGNYIHGTDAAEQHRLGAMNAAMNSACLQRVQPRVGDKVLDLGSGLGQFSRVMSATVGPTGKVVAVERDARQFQAALDGAKQDGQEGLVDFRNGDAFAPPLADDEWATFDLAHTRFLLEHVPQPLEIVRTMVRAVTPGGRIALLDDDHDLLRLWPEPPGVAEIWRAYVRSYDRLGNDPFIGRRLVELLVRAGATPTRCDWVFFGGCQGVPSFQPLIENLRRIFLGAKGTLIGLDLTDNASFDAAIAALDEWKVRRDAALWYAIAFAEGHR